MGTKEEGINYYNKGNDCDCCANQYLCGEYGDAVGCKCADEDTECKFKLVGEEKKQMTENQVKFLKLLISEGELTAREICKKLQIEQYENDPIGGYYNALNDYIKYFSEEEQEFDDMVKIVESTGPNSNNDVYQITSKGEKYINEHQ